MSLCYLGVLSLLQYTYTLFPQGYYTEFHTGNRTIAHYQCYYIIVGYTVDIMVMVSRFR